MVNIIELEGEDNVHVDSSCEIAILTECHNPTFDQNNNLTTLVLLMCDMPQLDFLVLANQFPNVRVLVVEDGQAVNVQRGLERMRHLEYIRCTNCDVKKIVDLQNVTARHVNVDFPITNASHVVSYFAHMVNWGRFRFDDARVATVGNYDTMTTWPLTTGAFRSMEIFGCPLDKVPSDIGDGPPMTLVMDLGDCGDEKACVARLASYAGRLKEVVVTSGCRGSTFVKIMEDDPKLYDSLGDFEAALRVVCPSTTIRFELRDGHYHDDEVAKICIARKIFENIDEKIARKFVCY